jgi:hypothetical protein
MVSPWGANPEMVIRLTSVMPAHPLVSGLMPRMFGGAPIGPPLALPCYADPPPECSGVPSRYAMIGEDSLGGAVAAAISRPGWPRCRTCSGGC